METDQERRECELEEDLKRLEELRPIDDDFMRCLFKDNKPLAQMVLRILTGKQSLVVADLKTQVDMKRLAGARSICLDVFCHDEYGKAYDLEIQRSDSGAGAHRARYHSSILDVEHLKEGQSFDELPDTYVIFITENDIYGKGLPFYPIERINTATGLPFEDGEHILYVNGAYRNDDEIGKLMHDFSCTKASDMYFEDMADATRYYKETPEGRQIMCKAMEDMRNETKDRTLLETIRNLMENLKLTAEQAMDAMGIASDDRARLSRMI